ncbi:MAG: tryptophan halogenase family protein [Pirellulales bacterium]
MQNRIDNVLILGGGSAGFLAAITLRYRHPQLPVTVLRSKEIGVIGVGEATTIVLPQHLHDYLKLDLKEFYALAQPQWKLGIRFLWGKRPFFDYSFNHQLDSKYQLLPKVTGYYCRGPMDYVGVTSGLMTQNKVFARDAQGRPIVNNGLAYHIENVTFVNYLEAIARRMGVTIQEGIVEEVLQDEHGVTGLRVASGAVVASDLFVDCSGFVSLLVDKTLHEPYISFTPSLFNDRAVVGSWQRDDEPIKPYTTAETMSAGWCWQIDHEFHINRGYVYSSDFISDHEAETEFRQKNPKITSTRVVRYRTGRFVSAWVKNVVAVGNSSGFVEPLESTGLAAICGQTNVLAEALHECDRQIRPSVRELYNRRNASSWDQIRRFLSIHFKFNYRYETPYWRACQNDADIESAADIVACYQQLGPTTLWRSIMLDPRDQFGTEGYLSLLVGQEVPYESSHTPSAEEWSNWERIQQAIRRQVSFGLSVREGLELIRSPKWQWPPNLYGQSPMM